MKEAPRPSAPKLVMKVPTPFRYTSDKAVPWNYTSQAVVQEPQAATKQKQETSVNDIARTKGMSHSGRCYALIDLEAKKGKESVEEDRVKITVPKGKRQRGNK